MIERNKWFILWLVIGFALGAEITHRILMSNDPFPSVSCFFDFISQLFIPIMGGGVVPLSTGQKTGKPRQGFFLWPAYSPTLETEPVTQEPSPVKCSQPEPVPAPEPIQTQDKHTLNTDDAILTWHTWLESRALARKTIKGYMQWGERMAKRWNTFTPETFPECVQIASASLRRQGYSATTIHGFQCAMASFAECLFSWDEDDRKCLITAKPVKSKKPVPNVDEIGQFLRHLPQPARLIALLCYCCGLRISEAVSLQLEDCNLVDCRLTVKQSKCSKGRTIPIPPELIEAIKSRADKAIQVYQDDLKQGDVYAPMRDGDFIRHIKRSQEPGQWPLFPQSTLVPERRVNGFVRVPIHASVIEKAFKAARGKSGVITKITPHRLRDAYAVHSVTAGVPLNIIQLHMGHHSLETTAKYLTYMISDEGLKAFTGLNLFNNLKSA